MKHVDIDSFLELRFLSDLELAPDGKHLAFAVHRGNGEGDKYDSNLWVRPVGGGECRQLTAGNEERKLLWLDGDTLLFSGCRDRALAARVGEGEQWTVFYAIGLDGGEAREYMRLPVAAKAVAVIDRDRFAVTATVDRRHPAVNGLAGGERLEAVEKLRAEQDYQVMEELPYWANGGGCTDGKRDILFLFDRRTGELTRISGEQCNVRNVVVEGGRLLYIATRFEGVLSGYDDLWCYDLEGGGRERLIPEGTYSLRSAAFAGGKVVFFGSTMDSYGKKQNPDLYAVEPGGVRLVARCDLGYGNTVGSDCRFSGGNFGTAPALRIWDGRVYVLVTEGNVSLVKEICLDGSVRDVTAPVGSVDYFDVCGDGVYFVGLRGNTPQELYSCLGGVEERLTGFNRAFAEGHALSTPERVAWENGGLGFEGFVLKPAGYVPGRRYPAILEIHGGPKLVYSDVLCHEMQFFAAKGYFVFFTNPRGSDGRGDAFADLKGRWGTVDYDDLMAFTDTVLERYPDIDRERVGVTGGSYGGFMTNWIIGHTGRFRCAVSQRGIANWTTQFACTDIGYNMVAQEITAMPWEDMDKVWEQSPMKYAGNVTTPTLFLHSEQDYRCWMVEAMQMFSALRYRGVETRLCLFKGENHELSRSGKPRHRIRRLEELLGWFERYLK